MKHLKNPSSVILAVVLFAQYNEWMDGRNWRG